MRRQPRDGGSERVQQQIEGGGVRLGSTAARIAGFAGEEFRLVAPDDLRRRGRSAGRGSSPAVQVSGAPCSPFANSEIPARAYSDHTAHWRSDSCERAPSAPWTTWTAGDDKTAASRSAAARSHQADEAKFSARRSRDTAAVDPRRTRRLRSAAARVRLPPSRGWRRIERCRRLCRHAVSGVGRFDADPSRSRRPASRVEADVDEDRMPTRTSAASLTVRDSSSALRHSNASVDAVAMKRMRFPPKSSFQPPN